MKKTTRPTTRTRRATSPAKPRSTAPLPPDGQEHHNRQSAADFDRVLGPHPRGDDLLSDEELQAFFPQSGPAAPDEET
jgi:hypothetical protein